MVSKKRQIIALVFIALMMVLIYLSSYLPYMKGKLYIDAVRQAMQAKSLDEFITPFEKTFSFWSPVGQPEALRFFAGDVSSILQNNQQLPKEIAKALVDYTIQVLSSNPLGAKGLNYSQNVLFKATILSTYGFNYKDEEALKKAEDYYKEGLTLSPTRPQFLYGLFSFYLNLGKKEEAKNVGNEILKYWPEDINVAKALKELN